MCLLLGRIGDDQAEFDPPPFSGLPRTQGVFRSAFQDGVACEFLGPSPFLGRKRLAQVIFVHRDGSRSCSAQAGRLGCDAPGSVPASSASHGLWGTLPRELHRHGGWLLLPMQILRQQLHDEHQLECLTRPGSGIVDEETLKHMVQRKRDG